jgi:zinc transport system ATP-binding protein
MPLPELVKVDNLSFYFGHQAIFLNVSLTISQGDFVLIKGVNGAGKSTLIRLIVGELDPTSGTIVRNCQDISYLEQIKMSQELSFPATSLEVVLLGTIKKNKSLFFFSKDDKIKAREALNQVGLLDKAGVGLSKLSGGEQQRVLIAKSLLEDGQLLILDEPTSASDQEFSQSFYNLLAHLHTKHQKTIILVSHQDQHFDFPVRELRIENHQVLEIKNV